MMSLTTRLVFRRELRWLENCCIARGHRRDQRPQGQAQRIVPGADDEASTLRLINHAGSGAERRERRADPLRFHPALQIRNGMLHLADQRQHLGDVRFRRMLAQVTMSRLQDRILALENGRAGDS